MSFTHLCGLVLLFLWGNFAQAAINFAVIGDYGMNNDDEARVAELVKRNNPQFILTTGDNNYPYGCKATIDENIGKYYHEYIYNYQGTFGPGATTRRFFPTLGNHDWYALEKCLEPTGLPYFTYFDLPGNERYYDFVEGNVHFFALDSDIHEPDGNKKFLRQYRWLRDRVGASRATFKIAYFHHPPYSSGDHGNTLNMQWGFKDLGLDIVIGGHDHNYERIEKDGLVYIVNGLGGAQPRPIKKKVSGSKIFYDKNHGAMFVEAYDNTIRLQFKTVDDIIIDDVAMTKNTEHETPAPIESSPPQLPCQQQPQCEI